MQDCQTTELDARNSGLNAAVPRKLVGEDSPDQILHLYGDGSTERSRGWQNGKRNLSVDAQEKILALYDQYRPRLYRYIRSMQLGGCLAEEVIQETFMRLTVELLNESTIENVQGWIVRVAHNLTINLLKKERSRFVAPDASSFMIERHVDPAMGPDEIYSRGEQARRLRDALATMKPQQRKCFEMRAEGFRYKEIGLALGISEQRAAFVVKEVAVRLAAVCG